MTEMSRTAAPSSIRERPRPGSAGRPVYGLHEVESSRHQHYGWIDLPQEFTPHRMNPLHQPRQAKPRPLPSVHDSVNDRRRQ